MKRILFNCTLIVLILTGCEEDLVIQKARIVGNWSWEESSGGLAGITNTPSSTGYTQELEFKGNGIYTFYRADTVWQHGNYRISEELSIYSNDKIPTLTLLDAPYEPMAILKLSSDSLVLGDECLDCFLHVFTRINSAE